MSMSDKQFDEFLRETAHREEVPIPSGLENRLKEIYQQLEEPPQESIKGKPPVRRRIFTTARIAAFAAVLALCLGSMALGALAFSTERVTEVKVEVPVEVPVEREIIVLEEIGLSLILPDDWRDRYVVLPQKSGSGCHVYVKLIYDWYMEMGLDDGFDPGYGHLFSVAHCDDTPMTAEEFYAQDGHYATYLVSTEDGTYCVGYPTDVQWPMLPLYPPNEAERTTPEQVAAMEQEYRTMEREIADIQIVLNNIRMGTLEQNSPSK